MRDAYSLGTLYYAIKKHNIEFKNGRRVPLPDNRGRPKKMTSRAGKAIATALLSGSTCRQVAAQRSVSAMTVHRYGKKLDIVHRKTIAKPFLSTRNLTDRLAYAKEWSPRRPDKLHNIIWSDESTFALSRTSAQAKYVRKGAPPEVTHVFKKSKYLWVWGGVSWNGTTKLIFLDIKIDQGFKSKSYLDQVLRRRSQWLRPGLENMFLMEDGAPVHTAKICTDFKKAEGIKTFPPKGQKWPGNSPDLNPVENLWGVMKLHLSNLSKYPSKEDDLKKVLGNVWGTFDLAYCRNLLKNYQNRLKKVVSSNGDTILY